MHEKMKKYRVYYFVGDFWSSEGEKRKSTVILAHSESEAEKIFKSSSPKSFNFGWVEEI
jgi:hypothetical protein